MNDRTNRIKNSLNTLNPIHMELVDESHLHAGHSEEAKAGGTHYRLTLVSDFFTTLSRIERQQKINALLSDEFKTGLHALQMKLYSPDEYKK